MRRDIFGDKSLKLFNNDLINDVQFVDDNTDSMAETYELIKIELYVNVTSN